MRQLVAFVLAAVLDRSLFPASFVLVRELPLALTGSRIGPPKWSNGALLAVQYRDSVNPVIWVVDALGQRPVPFAIPGAREMRIYDWDRGVDGTIGLSGSIVDADKRFGAFIAWISPQVGSVPRVVRTAPYWARKIAVAPDGTLWTAGGEWRGGSPVPGAAVIRHFDRSGQVGNAFIPQSTLGDQHALSEPRNALRISSDRVAWFSISGRYVEISLASDAVIADRTVSIPSAEWTEINGFGLTNGGQVFIDANFKGAGAAHHGIHALDRSTYAWRPAATTQSLPVAEYSHLYGVDQENLVLSGKKRIYFCALE